MTTTEYYSDGTVKVVTDQADNNFESMPDITDLMKIYLPAPKKEDERINGAFEDPNAIRTEAEARMHGGRFFEAALPGMGAVIPKEPVYLPGPQILMMKPGPLLQATRN